MITSFFLSYPILSLFFPLIIDRISVPAVLAQIENCLTFISASELSSAEAKLRVPALGAILLDSGACVLLILMMLDRILRRTTFRYLNTLHNNRP